MGLENLKSVFNQGAGTNNSQISGRLSGGGELGSFANHPDEFSKLDFDTNVPTPVDFLTNNIEGFTINFDNKGSGLGTSKFVGQFSEFNDNQTFGFNKFQQSVDFMNELESNPRPTSISGFDMNFNTKGEGDGNSKYIGQTSEFNNNQIVGTIPFTQPVIEKNNKDIFDVNGNFKFNEQDVNYAPLDIKDPVDNKSIQFNTLYNSNQSAKEFKSIERGRELKFDSSNEQDRIFTPQRRFGDRGLEPYVVTDIPDNSNGRDFGRDFPAERSKNDLLRITRFLSSGKGIEFIAKQNFLGLNSKVITTGLSGTGKLEKKAGNQRFQTSYNPASTLASLIRVLGGQVPNLGLGFLFNREDPFPLDPTRLLVPRNYMEHLRARDIGRGAVDAAVNILPLSPAAAGLLGELDLPAQIQEDEFYNPGSFLEQSVKKLQNAVFGNNVKDLPKKGDKLTLSNMIKGDTLQDSGNDSVVGFTSIKTVIGNVEETPSLNVGTNIEREKAGLPLYFKDLRDKTYVFFRGYLSGITENVSPSWASETYIGRSEPVYIYERAEREITFTLKLFSTTRDELSIIYKKMNRLTSMCYPEYKEDKLFATSETVPIPSTNDAQNFTTIRTGPGKIRMKPPLVKFRMGDMYGSENNEMTGWIKSVSYSVPDNSVWETQRGRKVAKHVEANIGFQVIHGSPPDLNTKFYGYPKSLGGLF